MFRPIQYILIVQLVFIGQLFGQTNQLDLRLIEYKRAQNITYYSGVNGNASELMNSNTVLERVNPVSIILKGLMFGYQNIVSPQMGTNCGYQVSCSNYSKALIVKFGLFKGVFLSADRLLRCNHLNNSSTPNFYLDKNGLLIDPLNRYERKK